MEPAVRGSVPVPQECRVTTWPESANENALQVFMGRTAIKVDGLIFACFRLICVCFHGPALTRILPACPLSACPEGRFGPGCVHSCNCTGAPCDKVTGQCQCPAGTSGRHCENCECLHFFYINKKNLNNWLKFYMIKIMKMFMMIFAVCPEGFWGLGCGEICPGCENGGICDKHNGSCNCPAGFMGRLCQNCE